MKRLIFIPIIALGLYSVAQQPKKSSVINNDDRVADNSRMNTPYNNYVSKPVPEFAVSLLAQLAADGGKTLEAINIKEFSSAMPNGASVVPDAKVLPAEDTARGTNVAPAIAAAIKAAGKGQFIIIGPGEWVVSTPIELPPSKQINLVCLGNLHFNKRDGFRITQATGVDPQHHLFFYGMLSGRENLPRHTKSNYDAGQGPNWADLTNTAIDITNANKIYVLANKIQGFGNGVRISGGGGQGSQENTISFQFLDKNSNGITLRSLDGQSYVDKNHFMGFYGGSGRISGGLAILIDGFNGPARNGEIYNGAFRSNDFHLLVEQVDSIIVANGDITEPVFDITVEAGVNTGVFGTTGFQMRSVAPNFVRNPKYTGAGIFLASWLTKGMGVNGTIIGMPVFHMGRTLIGVNGKTDNQGNVVMDVKTPLSKSLRDALPLNIKTAVQP